MAINYSIAKMANPMDRESGEYKFYAKAQANGSVSINELAEEIAYATTLTDGAVTQLRRWILLNTELQKRLEELHYVKGQRTLTPLQHEAICHFLGEP